MYGSFNFPLIWSSFLFYRTRFIIDLFLISSGLDNLTQLNTCNYFQVSYYSSITKFENSSVSLKLQSGDRRKTDYWLRNIKFVIDPMRYSSFLGVDLNTIIKAIAHYLWNLSEWFRKIIIMYLVHFQIQWAYIQVQKCSDERPWLQI